LTISSSDVSPTPAWRNRRVFQKSRSVVSSAALHTMVDWDPALRFSYGAEEADFESASRRARLGQLFSGLPSLLPAREDRRKQSFDLVPILFCRILTQRNFQFISRQVFPAPLRERLIRV
jgi:hypothetical protein